MGGLSEDRTKKGRGGRKVERKGQWQRAMWNNNERSRTEVTNDHLHPYNRVRDEEQETNLLKTDGLYHAGEVGHDARGMRNVRQHVDLEVGRERVGQAHVARECTQHKVTHLDAVRGDDVAEGVVVVAEELGEVVQQHQENSQRALWVSIQFNSFWVGKSV